MTRQMMTAVATLILCGGVQAIAQEELRPGEVIDARLEQSSELLDFAYDADHAGILTIAVRVTDPSLSNDLFLSVVDAESEYATSGFQDLIGAVYGAGLTDVLPPGIEFADNDVAGDATAEQIAATVPRPGRYLVRVAAAEECDIRLASGFIPFPDVESAAVTPPEPVPIRIGEPVMDDVSGRQPRVYELRSPGDGLLTVVTRGSGDVVLAVLLPNEDGVMRTAAESDSDSGGMTANESIIVEVTQDQRVQIRLSALEPARCALLADFLEVSSEFADMAAEAAKGPPHPLEGEPLPELTLTTIDGEDVSLANIGKRVVVIDVWATWCAPCVRALPEVQSVYDWVEQEGLPVAVLAVNTGDTLRDVHSFLDQHALTLPVLMDTEGAAGSALQASAIPMTVIAADSRIQHVFTGLVPDHQEHIKSIVRSLLDAQQQQTLATPDAQ